MRKWFQAGVLAACVVPPTIVLSEARSEMLFQYKHWEVEIVEYEDGTFACLAEVDASTDSFSLWLYADNTVKLQFYSTSWDFGDGDTADLQLRVGSRSPWTLNSAELYRNSILFDLPNSDQSVNFLVEIAQGNSLALSTAAGEPVMEYSLAGSAASMEALIACGEALRDADGNPFD